MLSRSFNSDGTFKGFDFTIGEPYCYWEYNSHNYIYQFRITQMGDFVKIAVQNDATGYAKYNPFYNKLQTAIDLLKLRYRVNSVINT